MKGVWAASGEGLNPSGPPYQEPTALRCASPLHPPTSPSWDAAEEPPVQATSPWARTLAPTCSTCTG